MNLQSSAAGGNTTPFVLRAAIPEPPGGFAKMHHWIASDPRLTPSDVRVISALLFYAKGRGLCSPANRSIASYACVSLSTVKQSLDNLTNHGFVRRERVPRTERNATGRVIVLLWGDIPPATGQIPACQRPETGQSQARIQPDVRPESDHKEDRSVEKPETVKMPVPAPLERQRSETMAVAAMMALDSSRPTPATIADVIVRKVSERPAPVAAIPPVLNWPTPLTDGQRAYLDALPPEARVRFGELAPAKREELLAPHRLGFDRICAAESIAKLMPRARPGDRVVPSTTRELILELPGGPTEWVPLAAQALAIDFDNDAGYWRAYLQVAEAVHQGEFPAESTAKAHQQGMSPKALNRGAVFCTALKREGWSR